MLDEHWFKSLHVEAMRRGDLHRDRDPHVLFQASTIGALIDGAYEGDLSFAELAQHGDLGLGTVNRLDGEMIALDGHFYRADVDGTIAEIDPAEKTPFAVVAPFAPDVEERIEPELAHIEVLEVLDEILADDASCAVRIEAECEFVRLRSVPAQTPPYRPLVEVVAEQHEFELRDVRGTFVGFRFPLHVGGVELGGYHLHFIDEERRRGGHVLDGAWASMRIRIDRSSELRVELPPGVDLMDDELAAATHAVATEIEYGVGRNGSQEAQRKSLPG